MGFSPIPRTVELRPELSGGMYVNQLALRGWQWNGVSGFLEAFDVKFDRLLNQYNDVFASLSNSYASRQIGYVCPESVLTLFDHYKIFHCRYFSVTRRGLNEP